MTPELTKTLAVVLESVEKKCGKGSVMVLSADVEFDPDSIISTGSISLNAALGIGGYKKGRIVEIYGAEACIAGESFLKYEVWSEDKRINCKGGSIRRLYERFTGNTTEGEPKQGRHLQNNNCDFYVKSVDSEGKIIRNKVLDVVKTGKKTCFKLETNTGEVLFSTADHKFMTVDGFVPLSDLSEGDGIFVHNNTRVKTGNHCLNRPEVMVKYHPYLPTKKVKDGKTEKVYIYYRGQKSRLAYEAHLNNMSLSGFVNFLNEKTEIEISSLDFIPKGMHVHHLDEDFSNNNFSNLQLISPKEHGLLHSKDRLKNLSFVMVPSVVAKITEASEMETYDLKCAYPYNNYIAEGIVVHNSGKTTLALHAIAEAQAQGGIAAFIDAEHALDPLYASNIGVIIDRLVISQPDDGEQGLEIADMLIKSGEFAIIVIDSVAALTPRAEIEGDMDTNHVGRQARMMSQALRKITASVNKTKTSVIFINQLRSRIGVMYGNPETTSGGNALKYYASQRIDIRRIKTNTDKNDEATGNRTRIKVVKNKLAPPFKKVEIDIKFGVGIDKMTEIVDLAVEDKIIKKAGSWYSFGEEKLGQGTEKVLAFLKGNEKIKNDIVKQILENRGLE